MMRGIIYECVTIEPDGTERRRYIGQSLRKDPVDRWMEHLKSVRRGSLKIYEQLRVLDMNTEVEFRIVEELPVTGDPVSDRESLDRREIDLIAAGWVQGLCDWNVAKGGSQRDFKSPEVQARAKASLARPEVRIRAAASQKAVWNCPEMRASRSATQKVVQNRPEEKNKRSTAARRFNADLQVRAKMSSGMKAYYSCPEVSARRSALATAQHRRQRLSKLIRTFDRKAWMEMVLK